MAVVAHAVCRQILDQDGGRAEGGDDAVHAADDAQAVDRDRARVWLNAYRGRAVFDGDRCQHAVTSFVDDSREVRTFDGRMGEVQRRRGLLDQDADVGAAHRDPGDGWGWPSSRAGTPRSAC